MPGSPLRSDEKISTPPPLPLRIGKGDGDVVAVEGGSVFVGGTEDGKVVLVFVGSGAVEIAPAGATDSVVYEEGVPVQLVRINAIINPKQ